jgi:hypothetical protein
MDVARYLISLQLEQINLFELSIQLIVPRYVLKLSRKVRIVMLPLAIANNLATIPAHFRWLQ